MKNKPESMHPLDCLKMIAIYLIGFGLGCLVLDELHSTIRMLMGRYQ